jgi:hypothetical protein
MQNDPTEAMIDVGVDALFAGAFDLRSPLGQREAVAAIWRAMELVSADEFLADAKLRAQAGPFPVSSMRSA